MGIGAMIGGSIVSGVLGARSASRAADAQADAASDATRLQREIYYNDIERAQPFYDSGVNALAAFNYELGLGPRPGTMTAASAPVAPQPVATGQVGAETPQGNVFEYRGFQQTPGFQYALDQSQQAIQRNAAARSQRYSGATANALAADAQGRQNQEYGTWLNRVGGLAGQGSQITGQIANLGQNFGAQAGANALAAGNARASGYMGVNNAMQGMFGNLASVYSMNRLGYFGSPGQSNIFATNPIGGGGVY